MILQRKVRKQQPQFDWDFSLTEQGNWPASTPNNITNAACIEQDTWLQHKIMNTTFKPRIFKYLSHKPLSQIFCQIS